MTDRAGVDHVLDAIDNALWDWAESPDAMTVRYRANGESGPETLAESPARTLVDGEARLPSSVFEAANIYISTSGIEWVNASGQVVFRMPTAVARNLPADSFRIEHPRPPVDVASIRAALRDIPPPRVNREALRAALRDLPQPRWQPPQPSAIDEVMRELGVSLWPVSQEFTTRINAMGRAVMQFRSQFRLMLAARSTVSPRRAPETPKDQAARERALEARQNRNTGPSRNPHRHRGI